MRDDDARHNTAFGEKADEMEELSSATQAVWAGEATARAHRGTQVPIVWSAGFGYEDVDTWAETVHGRRGGHIYSRSSNPTVAAFEDKMRILEGAAAATSFSTGMAAVSNTLFALLTPGERVVSVKDSYGGTSRLFLAYLPRIGVEVELCDTSNAEQIEAAVAAGCRVLYLESPTNPTLKVTDIFRLAAAAHEVGAVVVVDNTFATPINQSPLALGADLVLHSATKYLGGHADVLGGVLCGSAELVDKVHHYREITGAALDPMAAYLLVRSLKTLALRVERQNENALAIARWLEEHEAVAEVNYPGLESDPDHFVASRQMRGYGGMLSFSLHGGFAAVKRALPRLRLAHLVANLGSVETLAGVPATTSHAECSEEERSAMGIPEGLVRYSAGIEDASDLIADLDQALAPAKVG